MPQPEVQAVVPYEQPALAQPKPLEVPLPPPADVKKIEAEAKESPSLLSPVLKIGLGVRTGLELNVHNERDVVTFSLYDGVVDQTMIRPYFSAQLTKHIGVVANFQFGSAKVLQAALLDAIVQVKIVDEFQIWGGQHIPAMDRLNFQGPFFNNGWNFEAPNTQNLPWDNGARDKGFTFWGLVGGGFFKYHLSMTDLQPGRNIANAGFSARANFNFWDPENYYYTSGTYYGSQDTFSVGGVIRGQKGTKRDDAGMLTDNGFLAGGVDMLLEKRFPSGVYTMQAQYLNLNGTGGGYKVNQGTADLGTGVGYFWPGQSFFGEVSWLAPSKVGIGQLQPNFHIGWGKDGSGGRSADEVKSMYYDAGIGYIIDGFNHRYYLNYRRMNHDSLGKGDSIQLGAQIQI
ncbi:MAG TPA: hypothetical protein VFX59_13390 [Polyangiales bacterium]|nr:hypothetical protein [Polyangiales bacterium]